MLRLTCERERQTHEKLAELSDRLGQSAADADNAKRESLEVLRMFEDQLHFMQQLCYSKDLQSVMFARFGSGFTFDDEMREELARRCASIGSFIDRQLGGSPIGDTPRLFSLASGESSEPAIREMLLRFDENESVHCRKAADLLISQVLMNDVLRNYVSELRARPHNRSVQKLEQLTAEVATLNEILGTTRKQNAKLKQKLRKIYRLTQGQDPVVFLRHKPSPAKEPSMSIHEHDSEQKATNERVADLEQLLAASREQLRALTAEHADSARQSEEQITRYDDLVAAKDRQIAKLLGKIERAKAVVGDARDDIDRLQAESEGLRQQLSASESKQSVLRTDKAKLADRIAKLEDVNAKGISEIRAKSAEIRVQYEARVAQIGKLRQSIRSLSGELGEREREIAQLRTDLDSERIGSKSVNLQLRSCEERFDVERKTFSSQLTAQQVAHDAELDRAAKSLARLTSQVNDRAGHYLGSAPADPLDGIDLLGSELLTLKKALKSYSALSGDIEDVRRLINVERNDQIPAAVRSALEEQRRLRAEVERCAENSERQKQETRKLVRENSSFRAQAAAVRQWESWARRLLTVVRDCNVRGLTGEQLRLALEESLLASAASRVMFFRLEMLRDEKKLLLRFGSGMMAENGRRSPEWNSILIALICIRRMQKIAGTLPIAWGA
jgi:predicted  nucleic acid-binding Zn-ribbon protein